MIAPLIQRGLAVLLLFAVAACGGGTTAASQDAAGGADGGAATESEAAGDGGGQEAGGGGIDLCAVISAEEVGEIAGTEVADTQTAEAADVSSCNWMDADGMPVAGTTWTRGNEALSPEALMNSYTSGEFEEVPDLGERAILAGDENFPIVMVLRNGAVYSVSVLADSVEGQARIDATIELARRTVDELP